uniref:CSON006601 protein n=1 Tax=Culicoides sonorensis TaxID=179676 RepID=A0A336KAT6_CULSO
MSLFPAYNTQNDEKDQNREETAVASTSSWLENESYKEQSSSSNNPSNVVTIEDESCSSDSDVQFIDESKKVGKKRKHKKEKKKSKKIQITIDENSDFYEDKKPLKAYLTVVTLKKPGCPRYDRSQNFSLIQYGYFDRPKYKRYYKAMKKFQLNDEKVKEFNDEENDLDLGFQKYLKSNPKDVDEWLKYVNFKDSTMPILDNYQKEKTKLDIVDKAMKFNPESETLLRKYLELLPKVHPTDEVLEIIERMINKNPNNFLTWNALIYNKQSSMAQCNVPDVLEKYQDCLKALFSVVKNDEILVKIFKNLAIFLRQSGLFEQFFSLLMLGLSLNVSTTAFNRISRTSDENNTTLIEFEELILRSGLPMNEIWLRIEKLRSAFNFLPCVTTDLKSDPQRIVLNEDICRFVYPLMNKNYNFDLFILVLKMLKYPLSGCLFQSSSFFSQEMYENDTIEDILSTFLELKRDSTMDAILFNIIKEIQVPPSYINTNLAHDLYRNMLFEVILTGASCFNQKQNLILFKLYLQLERILVVIEKISSKAENLTPEFKKQVKSRIKKAIKNMNYQSNLLIYNEYAWVTYELDGFEAAETILHTTIQQNFIDSTEFSRLCISYVELLILNGNNEKSIEILTGLVLGKVSFEQDVIELQATKKLIVLQKLTENLSNSLEVEMKSDMFEIEDYFSESKLMLNFKSKIIYVTLVKSVDESITVIRDILKKFPEKNQKHTFIREKIYEFIVFLYNTIGNHDKSLFEFILQGIQDLPSNLTLLRVIVSDLKTSWMNIKLKITKNLTTNSVIFLIAACRYRCAKYSIDVEGENYEDAYKKRVISLLEVVTDKKSGIRQNALLWRLYLRALFDVNSNQTLVKCRNTLYEALDVCPWNKALYLDGAFFSPQELPQLMDLILEKQLRIHAIPEELQILRNE